MKCLTARSWNTTFPIPKLQKTITSGVLGVRGISSKFSYSNVIFNLAAVTSLKTNVGMDNNQTDTKDVLTEAWKIAPSYETHHTLTGKIIYNTTPNKDTKRQWLYLIFIAGWQCTKVHCSETDVIFLYNARIQWIEIHEQDKLVVETLPRFQNKTTCVSRLSLPSCTFLLLLPMGSIIHVIFIHLLNRFLCIMLVRYNEVLFCECV